MKAAVVLSALNPVSTNGAVIPVITNPAVETSAAICGTPDSGLP